METGHNRRELDICSSSKIEIVGPVAEGKATRFLAQSEEGAGKVCTRANGDHNVLAIAIKLKVDVWCRDRVLSQRQPRFILQGNAEQQLWSCRSLNRAACLLRVYPSGSQ